MEDQSQRLRRLLAQKHPLHENFQILHHGTKLRIHRQNQTDAGMLLVKFQMAVRNGVVHPVVDVQRHGSLVPHSGTANVGFVRQNQRCREGAHRLAGAEVEHGEGYPGWNPDPSSRLLRVAETAYERLFGTRPKVRAIHAGLECGLFLEKYPKLEMISVGPTLRGVHSPDERLEIATVDKFWKFLIEILRTL